MLEEYDWLAECGWGLGAAGDAEKFEYVAVGCDDFVFLPGVAVASDDLAL